MKSIDKGRKWFWLFLGVAGALQWYLVQELLAAFALFTVGFLVIAALSGSLYLLHRTWAAAVDWIVATKHPVMVATRQGSRSAMIGEH